jgi:hypothetical protein
MKCHDFEDVVRELSLVENQSAALAPNVYSQVRVHIDDCELCGLRLADERELNRRFRALASDMKQYQHSARLEEKLRQTFRETLAASAGSDVARSAGHASKNYWLAAAAIVVFVFTVALLRSRFAPAAPQTGQQIEARVAAESNTEVPIDSAAAAAALATSKKHDDVARAPRRKRVHLIPERVIHETESNLTTSAANTTSANAADPEIATEFVALSSVPANFQDGGQIVRVELSRSAMASLGFPVNVDRFGERVKADVLLSADGFARAIRFVQ